MEGKALQLKKQINKQMQECQEEFKKNPMQFFFFCRLFD